MTLMEFNKKYSYQTDIEKYGFSDVWEIIEPDSEGNYRGDCESYARTLKKLIPEFKDWNYYYCKLNGIGHCLLYKNDDVIDCNIKHIVSFDTYCRIYKVTEFRPYTKLQVICKIIFSKGVILWKRLRGF